MTLPTWATEKARELHDATKHLSDPQAVMDRIALALVAADTAARQQQWQPIETATPKEGDVVLGYCPTYYQLKGGCAVLVFFQGQWFDNGAFVTTPTHWQPLPAPPKES